MSDAAGWTAGVAQRPFPVEPGTPLAGYAARTSSAMGVLDEPTVGALLLERDGARLAVVAADIVAVDAALVDEVAAAAGLRPGELLLAASHTHSGPAGIVARLHPAAPSDLDPARRAAFVAAAASAITGAGGSAEPVQVAFGACEAPGVAANRNDPAGPRDDRVGVLTTRRDDGSVQAVIVHFACHPTVLGADNLLASADFPGALRTSLAAMVADAGRRPVVLFVNGAAGDVSTRFTRRGQDASEVARVGSAVARAANAALQCARPVRGALAHDRRAVILQARIPDRGAATSRPAALQTSDATHRVTETRAQGSAMLAALAAQPVAPLPTVFDLDGWVVGDLVLIGVPGELSAALGRRVGSFRTEPTLVVGYANGYVGYLPDRAAYEIETYEALASPFAPGCGEEVAEAANELARRFGGEPRPNGGSSP